MGAMTLLGAANGAFALLALGFVVLKCLEPAQSRPQYPWGLKLVLPMVGLSQLIQATRPGSLLERFSLLVAVLLAGLGLVIEYVRAVRFERSRNAAAPTPPSSVS